jgi:hypothetical protein
MKPIRSGGACYSVHCAAPPALAQSLLATQGQMEGPFYLDRLPFDQNKELTMVAGRHAPATGGITDLTGASSMCAASPCAG